MPAKADYRMVRRGRGRLLVSAKPSLHLRSIFRGIDQAAESPCIYHEVYRREMRGGSKTFGEAVAKLVLRYAGSIGVTLRLEGEVIYAGPPEKVKGQAIERMIGDHKAGLVIAMKEELQRAVRPS
jgi:hypothetical protein